MTCFAVVPLSIGKGVSWAVETGWTVFTEGAEDYQCCRDKLAADPEYGVVYAEGAAKNDLWFRLVEARQAADLTQAGLASDYVCPRRRWPA